MVYRWVQHAVAAQFMMLTIHVKAGQHLALRFALLGAELWRWEGPSPAEKGLEASVRGCEAAGPRGGPPLGGAPSRAVRDSSALITGAAAAASVALPTALDMPEAASWAASSLGLHAVVGTCLFLIRSSAARGAIPRLASLVEQTLLSCISAHPSACLAHRISHRISQTSSFMPSNTCNLSQV